MNIEKFKICAQIDIDKIIYSQVTFLNIHKSIY